MQSITTVNVYIYLYVESEGDSMKPWGKSLNSRLQLRSKKQLRGLMQPVFYMF